MCWEGRRGACTPKVCKVCWIEWWKNGNFGERIPLAAVRLCDGPRELRVLWLATAALYTLTAGSDGVVGRPPATPVWRFSAGMLGQFKPCTWKAGTPIADAA